MRNLNLSGANLSGVALINTNLLALAEQSSEPAPSTTGGALTVWFDGSDLNSTATDGSTQTYLTASQAGNTFLLRAGGSMTGPLDMGGNDIANVRMLSGAVSSRLVDDIVSGPGAAIALDLPVFADSGGRLVVDSGIASTNIVTNSGSSFPGDVAVFTGSSGKMVLDTGIASANLVSNIGNAASGNLASFSDSSGKNVADSGITPGSLLATSGGTMTGPLAMSGNNVTDLGAIMPTGSILIGNDASSSDRHTGISIGNTATTASDGISLGNYSIASGIGAVAIGKQSWAIGSGGVALGAGSMAAGLSGIAIGSNSLNTTDNSCVIGDSVMQNVRPGGGNCSLGTLLSPFQNMYLSGGIDGLGALTMGANSATTLTFGRSGTTTTVNGNFVTTTAYASWYSSTSFFPLLTHTNALISPTMSTLGICSQFAMTSPGILTYVGSRARTFRVEYSISFITPIVPTTLLWFNAVNGSTVVGSTTALARYQVNANNQDLGAHVTVSDITSLNYGNTIQLGGSAAPSNARPSIDFVSCMVSGMLN